MAYLGKVPADVLVDPLVTSASLVDGTIITADIANDAVTAAKLAANSVDSSELIDGSIDNGHLAGSIAINKTLLAGGTGLTLSTNTLNVDAAQTQITSVGTLTSLATSGNVSLDNSGSLTRMTIENNTESNILFTLGGASKGQLYADSNGISIRSESSVPLLFKTNGNTTALTLGTDQSATFAGFLNDTKIYNHLKFVASDGTTVHGGIRGASNSVEIRTGASTTLACTFDGSQNATFEGDVTLGGDILLETTYTNLQIYKPSNSTGLVFASGASNSNSRNWGIYTNYSDWGHLDFRVSTARGDAVAHTTEVLSLKRDASAVFAGVVNATRDGSGFNSYIFNDNGAGEGLHIKVKGNDSGQTGRYLIKAEGYGSSGAFTNNFLVDTDGNATFAGTINTTGTTFNSTGHNYIFNSEYAMYFNVDSPGGTAERFIFGVGRTGTSGGAEWLNITNSISTFNTDLKISDDLYFNGTDNNAWVIGKTNGSGILRIQNFATLRVDGSINEISDKSLKENIKTFSNGLSKINQLRGVSYKRNDHEDKKVHLGLVAQEVEAIIPEIVSEDEDSGLKSVAYSNMIAVVIEAIKELSAEVEKLKGN